MSFFKKQEKSTEAGSKELQKRIETLEEKLEQTIKEFGDFKKNMQRAITKVGMTRFNPFKEIGGDQSFSVALLDENNKGVVITSYYARETNRVYAKPIQKGNSEHHLTQEEQEAVQKAIHGN